MQVTWRANPFLRITLSLITGILVVSVFHDRVGHHYLTGILLIPCLVSGILSLIRPSAAALTIYLLSGIMLMGALAWLSRLPVHDSRHFSHRIADGRLHGRAHVQDIVVSGRGTRMTVGLDHCLVGGSWQPCTGRLQLQSRDSLTDLACGDLVAFAADVAEPSGPANPHGFDYRRWMQSKQIWYQGRVPSGQLVPLEGIHSASILVRKARILRDYCVGRLHHLLPDHGTASVASALILGYTSEIPEDLQESYRVTGATHVLSVSGLHTGIVAGLLLWLVGCIPGNSLWIRCLRALIAICGVWCFALVAGMVPPVVRAAAMFSMILAGKTLIRRPVATINCLAAAACCMLLWDPFVLSDLGFQLSYTALLGILLFQPAIERLLAPRWKPARQAWSLIAVSFAAQLGTLPITVFHFHQLPFYAWLSGMLVVPLSALILPLGFMALFTDLVLPGLAAVPGHLLGALVWCMNEGVSVCHRLPALPFDGWWLAWYEAVLLGVVLLAGTACVLGARERMLGIALGGMLIFALLQAHGMQRVAGQEVVTAYAAGGHILVDYYRGRSCVCVTDLQDDARIRKLTANNRYAHRIYDCALRSAGEEMSLSSLRYTEGLVALAGGDSWQWQGRRGWAQGLREDRVQLVFAGEDQPAMTESGQWELIFSSAGWQGEGLLSWQVRKHR